MKNKKNMEETEFPTNEEYLEEAYKYASVIQQSGDDRENLEKYLRYDSKWFKQFVTLCNPEFDLPKHLAIIKNRLCDDWLHKRADSEEIKEIWFTRDQLIELINYVKQVK